MNKFFKIITYGCQMNIHDSEKLAGILSVLGYQPCEEINDADLILFNTCCIRENAEQHAYGNIGALKSLKKKKPNLIIAVGGCMTQQSGAAEKLKKTFPFVDIVFGTFNSNEFSDMLTKRLNGSKNSIFVRDEAGKVVEGEKPLRTSYPNAWVNIVYGCNNFCSYCIVPYVRGRERSRRSDEIFSEVYKLVVSGYKEVTLLGQNVNSYGHDLENENFSKLLLSFNAINTDFRLRFMSSHPKDFTEELAQSIAESKHACHSIHLPVQAGSDRILKLMNRKYTRSDYLKEVELIKKYLPDATITTDIMVGFPTETEEDFCDTLELVKSVGFSNSFTFVYSPRSGTPAAKMEGQISDEVKKERIMRLVALQNEVTKNSSKDYIDKTVKILCEDYDDKKNVYLGRDEYGKMAYFSSEKNLIGEFVDVKINKANGISLFGDIVEE